MVQARSPHARRRHAAAHRSVVQPADRRHGILARRLDADIPAGSTQRLVRHNHSLHIRLAVHASGHRGQVPPASRLHHLRPSGRTVLLHDIRTQHPARVRQRRASCRVDPYRTAGRSVRRQALFQARAPADDPLRLRAAAVDIRVRHSLQRHQRIYLLGRVRRALQLHCRRLPDLHQRGHRQHHGVVSDNTARRHHARHYGSRDMGAVPPRYTSNRPYGGGLALEGRHLARLPCRSRRSLRPACLQHALAADAQRLSQRVAGQRSV